MSIALPEINRSLNHQTVRVRREQSMLTTKTVNSYTADAATADTATADANEQFNNDNNHNNQSLSADPTTADNEMDQLNAANDNCVENIATMKIADDSNMVALHQQLNNNNKLYCHNNNNNNNNNNDDDDEFSSSMDSNDDWADAMSSADGPLDNLAEDYSLARLFLNDVEINRNEEEQTITELVDASGQGALMEANQNTSMRVAFGIILRLVLPLANGVVRGFKGIRDARFLRVLRSIASSRQALTSLVAFAANTISLNLSSVQVSHRIEPILKLMKIRKSRDGVESLPDVPSTDGVSSPGLPSTVTTTAYSSIIREPKGSLPPFSTSKRKSLVPPPPAPKCCTLNVLAEPPPGQPIRADIVFIHGLHGSQVNTWKQGLWENDRQPVGFERPPKPPVRPPKRPRHSRALHHMHPPHKQKRARFAHGDHHRAPHERNIGDDLDDYGDTQGNSFSYVCGEPQDIQLCDGFEYSFPTFRMRANDNGRQLQAELESMLHDANADPSNGAKKCVNGAKGKGKNAPKPSPDDPDYSKCWPGDWLPLDCPGVRVIALNYTTDQYLWRPLWKKKEPRSNLIERSREMAELLIQHRVGYGHPIVWVGHSKGGLFVKQIIVDAWESGRPAMAPFWRSARGVFFYSVPHRGSHLASIKAPLLTRSVELLDIEKNSKYLLDLHRRFAGLYHLGHLKIEVFSFVETALTLMSVLYLRIVGVDSADPGIGDVCGIRLDHREICKPRSRDCILYKELVKMINKVC